MTGALNGQIKFREKQPDVACNAPIPFRESSPTGITNLSPNRDAPTLSAATIASTIWPAHHARLQARGAALNSVIFLVSGIICWPNAVNMRPARARVVHSKNPHRALLCNDNGIIRALQLMNRRFFIAQCERAPSAFKYVFSTWALTKMLYLVKSTMPAAKKIQNKFIFLHLNNGRRFYAGSD